MKICDFLNICSNRDSLTIFLLEPDGGVYFEGAYDELDDDLLTTEFDNWEIRDESTLAIRMVYDSDE